MSQTQPPRHLGTLCGHMVEKGHVAYQCSLIQGHSANLGEPHYAVEVPSSVRAWQQWDEEMNKMAANTDSEAEAKFFADHPIQQTDSIARLGAFHHVMPDPMAAVNDAHKAAMGIPDVKLGEKIEEIQKPAASSERCRSIYSPENPAFRCVLKVGHDTNHARGTVRWAFGPEIEAPVSEPTKVRPGDQALPTGGQECIQDIIIAEMQESKRVGLDRYGSVLMTFNGRRGIQDVAEEVRDLHVYLATIAREAEATRETLIAVVQQAFRDESTKDYGDVPYTERADLATLAVDRIMGWVVSNRADPVPT